MSETAAAPGTEPRHIPYPPVDPSTRLALRLETLKTAERLITVAVQYGRLEQDDDGSRVVALANKLWEFVDDQ